MSLALYLLLGTATFLVPVISAIVWFFISRPILPGIKEELARTLRLYEGRRRMNHVISASQLLFYASCIITIPLSVLFELVIAVPLVLLFGLDNPYVLTVVGAFAGPIEESMKLVPAILVFFVIRRTTKGHKNEVDPVRAGMMAGLFAGACFGFVESMGYIGPLFWEMESNGIGIRSVELFIWRAVLGVSIHAAYTGLASGGLGRKGAGSRIRITGILLGLAILLHALNNAMEGFIILILEMDNITGYILTDSVQMVFIIILLSLLSMVWKGRIFPRDIGVRKYPPVKRKSQMIYSRRLN